MLDVDTAALDELERKLTIAERDFIESDLERRIEEMRAARIAQVRTQPSHEFSLVAKNNSLLFRTNG